MLEFGLPLTTTRAIRHILTEVPAVEKAVIYGSRAKGNHRPGSDIDLTLFGQGLNLDMLSKIAAQLDESPIPYQVDLSLFDQIDHAGLRAHIERVGKLFYQRSHSKTAERICEAAAMNCRFE
ncbi:nucleotidyltransferase domain-containing protein [Thiorhodovibrio frisius]|uniref:Putative nucleotidyltransferase n=1 Tax=Thiorhodovibrio frisius TaxID=631362 RepID=H8Z0S7_9GAMM|nr:nucleotidyltransferase domain-containing protein [Thiorhodovibrio frisius]EIC21309.1 putative nucleotidyltransferase [Thiorhodovibrio frisius]WPL23892.1 nucleotidyltransferase [Thiorhodovibrio frisius]